MFQALVDGQPPEPGLSDLLRTLGDGHDVEKGFLDFIEGVRTGRFLHTTVAGLYIDGFMDVVGFKNGEPVWALSSTDYPACA
jgi:hypothetical protein